MVGIWDEMKLSILPASTWDCKVNLMPNILQLLGFCVCCGIKVFEKLYAMKWEFLLKSMDSVKVWQDFILVNLNVSHSISNENKFHAIRSNELNCVHESAQVWTENLRTWIWKYYGFQNLEHWIFICIAKYAVILHLSKSWRLFYIR